MGKLVAGGVKEILWAGLPCMRDGKLDTDVKKINVAIEKAAEAHAEATYMSTYELFSKKGAYSAYIIQPTGIPLDVRESDGVHLNRQGADYLAQALIAKLK